MNTLSYRAPMLVPTRARNNIIMLDGLEFNISKDQPEKITELHNKGLTYNQISKIVKRDPYEVIVALLHQVRSNRKMKPFWEGLA